MCETEFDRGIEGKLIELFDVPNGIELNQVSDTLNLLLSSRFDQKLDFWMGLVGQVFQGIGIIIKRLNLKENSQLKTATYTGASRFQHVQLKLNFIILCVKRKKHGCLS